MRKLCAALSATAVMVWSATALPYSIPFARAAATSTSLQSQIDANTQEITTLTQEIAQYQAEIQSADADKKTLQGAINVLNLQLKKVQTQVAAMQSQINTTNLQIQQLGAGITSTEQQIETNQAALADEMRTLEEDAGEPLVIQMLSSGSLSDAWNDADATLEIQNAIQTEMQALTTQKNDLAHSQAASQQKQNMLTSQKKLLASQQASLAQTTQSKNQLLAETNAKESTYEKLLAQAQAQLASFSAFAQNAGGTGLLTDQTSCDSWGCYYNQRDTAWGNEALNGTQYLLKSDGCLITAMAMVLTHYGHTNVTPVSINADPNNFAAYYPAYLLFTIHVDGATATRITSVIDTTLATGNPVVVGLNAYGGTHYVVLISGSKGNYIMRDPYIANGKDISFSAHYSVKNIFGVSKVVIS
jgi:peptidoglycan hydrolase CwlO-like protein